MKKIKEPSVVTLTHLCQNAAFIRLKPNQKEPVGHDWKAKGMMANDVTKLFSDDLTMPQYNVGLLNGEPSGIIDVDLDCYEADGLADLLLSPALASFGREPYERSHRLYRVDVLDKTKQFRCKATGEMIVELRSTGTQTMVPPSMHPSGVQVEFTAYDPDYVPVSFQKLKDEVSLLAASACIARFWTKGQRHQLSLGYSGLLLKKGYEPILIGAIIEKICDLTKDEEKAARVKNVWASSEKSRMEISGFKLISEVLGETTAKNVSDWIPDLNHIIIHNDKPVLSLNYDLLNINELLIEDNMTEGKLAKAFSSWAFDKALFVHETKSWYLWNGNVWALDVSRKVNHVAFSFMNGLRQDGAKFGNRLASAELAKFESLSRLQNVTALAAPDLCQSILDFDSDPMVLACSNTWIDLATGKSLQPTHTKLVSTACPVMYDEQATCPHFLSFMNEIFMGNEDLISFVQRAVGYTLTGRNDEQCFFILNGDGANGKSTLINTLNQMLGAYSKQAASHTLMANGRQGVGDDLMHLIGARMITVSETDQGNNLAEAKVKQITGGDPITARALYGRYTTFTLDGKIWLATNSLPGIQNTDNGIWRRIMVVPFDRTFLAHEQDRDLPKRLSLETSGILNWAIKGCLEWQRFGLNPPKIVMDQVAEYRRDSDSVLKYIESDLIVGVDQSIQASRLFGAYGVWCKGQGIQSQSDKAFKKRLESTRGVSYLRRAEGRYYVGVNFR